MLAQPTAATHAEARISRAKPRFVACNILSASMARARTMSNAPRLSRGRPGSILPPGSLAMRKEPDEADAHLRIPLHDVQPRVRGVHAFGARPPAGRVPSLRWAPG
jgi:hypothetical protein